MLRTAVLLFVAIVAALIAVSLLPEDEAELPDSEIQLTDASVILYPRADAQAVWRFSAPAAVYDPDEGESILYDMNDGRREVAGEVDFTVASERLTINREDDILGDLVFAHLVETGECLTMRGGEGAPVLIDQENGVFQVPVMEISGPSWGEGTRLERMRVSFDLEEFDAGGPGTTTTTVFRVGGSDEERRSTVCERS